MFDCYRMGCAIAMLVLDRTKRMQLLPEKLEKEEWIQTKKACCLTK